MPAADTAVMGEDMMVGGAPEAAPDMGVAEEMPMDATGRDGSTVSGPTSVNDRQIIRTGYVSMRVEDVRGSASQIRGLAMAAGGMITSEDVGASGDSAYATLQAQVPADRLDAFIEDISGLGTVDSVNLSASDVTAQVVDLDARIDALRTSITRLTQLLAQASRIEDLLAIETQLSQRQSELDSLTAQRTYLADQVAMSTLTVSLAPLTTITEVDAPGFVSGLQSGWAAFVSLIMVAITAIGFLLPWLMVVAIVAVPVSIIAVRQSRRHRKADPSQVNQ